MFMFFFALMITVFLFDDHDLLFMSMLPFHDHDMKEAVETAPDCD
jgi:hypothetical protein